MVYGACLESMCVNLGTVGSNPTLSVIVKIKFEKKHISDILFIRLETWRDIWRIEIRVNSRW